MAEEKSIVIKKVEEVAGGGHGGSWKVALADFMTAMFCFFLVMWLTQQPEDIKKQVASYFSGPSMIEMEFTSYGAELTLEKLFFDLVNEPLRAIQEFLQPADFTPNLMKLGTKKIVLHFIADKLGDMASNVEIESDSVVFEIEDKYLFQPGTADPTGQFVDIMENLTELTTGLEDSRVDVTSSLYKESVASANIQAATFVATKRKDIVKSYVESSLEFDTVDVHGNIEIMPTPRRLPRVGRPGGKVRFEISQREETADGRKPRKLHGELGDSNKDLSVYEDFVQKLSNKKKK
jgi:chemotaxis protein MotB